MARPRKVLEGAVHTAPAKPADPVPGPNGAALSRIVAYFEAEFPNEWGALKLCPLQHGLVEMAALLDASE